MPGTGGCSDSGGTVGAPGSEAGGTTTMPQSKSSPESGVPVSAGAGGCSRAAGSSAGMLVICGVTELKLRISPPTVTLFSVTSPATPGAMRRSPEIVMSDSAAPPAALRRRLPSTLME